jgi:hypothetical protein
MDALRKICKQLSETLRFYFFWFLCRILHLMLAIIELNSYSYDKSNDFLEQNILKNLQLNWKRRRS